MRRFYTLLKQFPIQVAFRIFIVDIVRKLCDPYRMSSYSQTGEDRIIDFYLDLKYPQLIYYVDIGCNKPFALSNTMRLYQSGARGLAVDANQSIINTYAKLRPRDACVCACISDRTGSGVLTIAKQDTMSTVSGKFAEDFLSDDAVSDRLTVEFVPAQHLFEKNGVPTDFDLLNIDVEGHDLEVLRSFDLSIYRPKLIVVEIHKAREGLDALMTDDVYLYLTMNGYKLCAFATMNGYFVRQ